MNKYRSYVPLILAVFFYILIYLVRLQQGGWEPQLDLIPRFRQDLDERIGQFLPSPQAQLLSGIVLGNKKDLPYDLRLALRDTSTIHMIVVSGQNISLLAGLIMNLSGLINRKIAIVVTVVVISGLVVITGGQIPVLRAAIMAFLSYLAVLLGRQSDGIWTLVLVAGLMLLINPLWILDLSFRLSFLATFGVVVVSPIIVRLLDRLPTILRENLSITLAAQLMVTPFIIQHFHQLSLVGVPANLLVLWTIPYIMSGGLVLLLVGGISTFLGQIVAWGLQVLLTYFIYIVQFFASLPFAWEYVGEQIWIVWMGYYLILAGLLLFFRHFEQSEKSQD